MNAFEALADRQTPNPVKSRIHAVETRRERMSRAALEAEKRLEEKDILLRFYKRERRAELKALMSGAHGKEVRGLVAFMRTMTLSSAPALVRVVENARWIATLEPRDREMIWSLVFRGIQALREKNGLSFWEDPLPDEEPKAFCRIEKVLREVRE